MKPWAERGESQSVFQISEQASKALATVPDAMIFPIVPPAVAALGNSSGFEFQLVDRAGLGQDAFNVAMHQFIEEANQSGLLNRVRFSGLPPSPQYDIDIDSGKARALGVRIATINQTLSTALGGSYINDFIENGRIKRVYAQADAEYRMLPADIERWHVRNASGGMVPLSTFGSGEWTYGASKLTRFNGKSSLEIQGQAAKGISSGEALNKVSKLVENLPEGIGLQWTGLSYEEKQSGGQAWIVYMISIIAVFLALAALYESWTIPLAIMLTVPLGIFGAVLATWGAGQANDVYFQVGLLMTIALAAKNAILIIEFAKTNLEEGMSAYDSAVTAAKQRLRPILMTSLTFILGIMPLAFASGPRWGAQNAISIGVFGGIAATTVFVLSFAPFFFIVVMRLLKKDEAKKA
ncbi:MAG: multidrug efflux pump [Glaciecola sp.]|jgi:multidrug efflux pump